VQQLERERGPDLGAAIVASIMITAPSRIEEDHTRPGHERRPEERLRSGVRMIGVDDDEFRSHTSQCVSRCLVRLRKVWSISGELDDAPQKGRGERILGKDQYIVMTHINFPARGSEVRCRDCVGAASKRETKQATARGVRGP